MNLTKAIIPFYTYLLALQKCCTDCPWTIHGLWIDYTRGGYPQFCKNVEWNVDELNSMKNALEKYWPSCYGKSSGLWEHEWKKHGTCFEGATLVNYFNTTLHLFAAHKNSCTRPQHSQTDCWIKLEGEKIEFKMKS